MAITQAEWARQIIAQLRLLDPAVSADVGTPERKIIDTVAQALSDAQVDLTGLVGALDLDSKFGAALDRFLAIFGFARQRATFATGFVTFSRVTPANVDIRIPAGAQVRAPTVVEENGDFADLDVVFHTIENGTLIAGQTSVIVPVRANFAGTTGNVAANKITETIGQPILGITDVTNEVATRGGLDLETDEEFKIRFKNTVFRNLAGTSDQFLALAIATAFTTKANVIGPVSTYREYVQVPFVADNASWDVNDLDQDPLTDQEAGGGNAGQYTTALSTIPYAKHIWSDRPVYLSNGKSGLESIFYRESVDYRFNNPPLDVGDAHRYLLAAIGVDPDDSPLTPNLTFFNVYTGVNGDVQAVRPGDVVLVEFDYLSSASRNDVDNRIANAVDIYLDGGNDTFATAVTTVPSSATAFVDDPNSKYHYENYRRGGDPVERPLPGNILMPLFWQPVTGLPDQIVVNDVIYKLGEHYNLVEDTSEIGGTVRGRSGIEWSKVIRGKESGDPDWTDLTISPAYTGPFIDGHAASSVVEIEEYQYDRNIYDTQSNVERNKQVATDALVHKAKFRYFKLDVTAMYSDHHNHAEANLLANQEIDRFLKSQYYGSVIQLSDLIQVLHNTPGFDNVRWSSDIPNNDDLVRVIETDRFGRPLLGVRVEHVQIGTASQPAIQHVHLMGEPTSGTWALHYNGNGGLTLDWDATAAEVDTAMTGVSGMGATTITEVTRSTTGVTAPIRTFRVTWDANGAKNILAPNIIRLKGGPTIFSNDIFLQDNELASLAEVDYSPPAAYLIQYWPFIADTVPGLIIRPRAQNTWISS